ncbi:glycosyltransferase [Providencia sp. wls1919]|nr:glycosyltransferase [Providencia sp. wls1919]
MSVYRSDNPIFLRKAIESILNQTIRNDLYLFRDGEVSHDLQNVINEYVSNGKIKYYYKPKNSGLASSLNFLIDIIIEKNYHYIARMDSDDISLPERLFLQKSFLDNNPNIDILGTGCEEFGTNYALIEKKLPSEHKELVNFSITRCPFIHPSVMFRRKVFEDGNRYPTHTCFTEDMAFWLELLYKNYKFHNLPDILLKYRLEQNTMSRRAGLSKAKSEVSLRLGYMFLLNKFSFKNLIFIYSRYFFHLLPPKLMSLAYKYLR